MATVNKNIALNGIGQISIRLVRVVEQLVMVPIFLSIWGPDYYGEWLTISIIPSVLAFSDLGFGTAVSNSFVLAYSKQENNKAGNIFSTGFVVTTGTVLLGVLLSFIIVFVSWKTGLLDKAIISVHDIILSLVFLMASRLISFYSQLFEGFFRAVHKASVSYNLHAVDGILRIGVGIITLVAGCNIVGYSIGQFVIGSVFVLFFAIFAKKQIKDLPRGYFKKDICKETIFTGFGFMLTPIWQSVLYQGSTFAVRIVLGPVAVAVFNTVRTVCQSVSSLFTIVNGSIYPEIQIAYGKKDMKLVKEIYVYSMQIVFLAAVSGFIFLLLFGRTAYGWWTHHELSVSNLVWYIFMLGIPFNALWWTAGTVFRAFNKPARFSLYGLICAVISTSLSLVLAYIIDLPGAAIGFVAMDVIMFFLIVPLANKEINVMPLELLNTKRLRNEIRGIFKR